MKISERLAALTKLAPKRDPATRQLYADDAQREKSYTHIRVYTIMVSTRNAHRVHETLFKKDDGKNPAEWSVWLAEHMPKIFAQSVLPGLGIMDSSQSWSVAKYIGWVGETTRREKRVKRKFRDSKVASKRNQAKRQGAKRGKNHIRRRHGNRKRKT